MNLLSISEKLFQPANASIRLDAERCLHAFDRFADCQACVEICPEQAFTFGPPPLMKESNCSDCRACLPACPVDAFEGKDSVSDLMQWAPQLQDETVEILCQRHPRPGTGPAANHVGLQIQGCLAGLGTGALVEAGRAGFGQIILRLDACEKCPWRQLEPVIKRQLWSANDLLTLWPPSPTIEYWEEVPRLDKDRPHWTAESPPLSRRGLFRRMRDRGRSSLAEAFIDATEETTDRSRRAGRDHQRLARMLAHRPSASALHQPVPPDPPLAAVRVTLDCSACGACARICPTGALEFFQDREKSTFELTLTTPFCIGCRACVHACPAVAVEVISQPALDQVLNPGLRSILLQGKLQICERCGAPFAASPKIDLCPVCSARRENPFGPPGVKHA